MVIRKLSGFVVVAVGSALAAWGADSSGTLMRAQELHRHTNYRASLALLNQQSSDAATNFLVGQNYFMLGDFKKSVEFMEKAVAEAPANAEYVDWLGRAYGRRAETGSALLAPGFALKARQAFEKSVELNPKDPDALSDLFDYYLDAPGFLGGGYEKAEAVVSKIAAVDPAEAFFERAKLEQKKKQFDRADLHLKEAIAATPKKAEALLVYAKFLAHQGRTKESDVVLAEAQSIDPNSPNVWYTKADLLIEQGRDLAQAKDLLEKYLHATITVDNPPKQEAERLLRQAGGA